MLSFSIPGRKVYAHELASWDAEGVVEEYMQRVYASAEGDVERLGNLAGGLSLEGGAAPVGKRVRRASLVPSGRRLVPHVASRELAGSDAAAWPCGLQRDEQGQAARARRRGSRCSWTSSSAAPRGRCERREPHALATHARS
jgi:hypothetical protein